MSKLLSIIIPTRNRQIYCVESIISILADIDERCEIVVQDNSSDDSLKQMLEKLNTNSIVYNYSTKPLSFIDNFEQAVNLSSGKYFIILGDDDSTTKDIVPIVEWMDKDGIESLSSTFVIDYVWPNEKIEKYKTGFLSIPNYKGGVEDINVDKNLQDLIRNGFLAYQAFNLPRTYHGIIKRSAMDKVKAKTGRYFGGLTPDIYSTVALACVIKNHKIIDYPFSIAGACPASATVNATVGGHAGELKDAPHFNNRGDYHWEETIPRYYSVETIWAETAIKALKNMEYPNWEKLFNKYKLYIYSIFINRKYIFNLALRETILVNKELNVSRSNHLFKICRSLFNNVFNKFFGNNKVFAVGEYSHSKDVPNLETCKKYVEEKIKLIVKFYEI